MSGPPPKSLLWIPGSTVNALLKCYDYPHPLKPGRIIRGYDKAHARRTAKMCAAVACHLGHGEGKIRRFQIACLLHDLGRAGLDRRIFGAIWTWARRMDIPTRPAQWRVAHPETIYGKETEAFWKKYQEELRSMGIETNAWAREQVEMRLGYARRMHRQLTRIRPVLTQLGIQWSAWMEKVTLYYYYPEKLAHEPVWVRELGEILVACEQLEAWSNRERGSDYYNRSEESLVDAFAYLETLCGKGQLHRKVLSAVRYLTSRGMFDAILKASRKRDLTETELRYLRSLDSGEKP